jgi:hypothetical protein
MTEVPKIVHDRLRATELARAETGASHPDADLLTALSEQTLLPAERDRLLQHLAACGDCRELVALALPPEAVTATPVTAETESARIALKTKSEKNWLNALTWPTLTWAALAAGVVVAGSVLLLHHGNSPVTTPANQQIAVNTPSAAPQISQPSAKAPAPARDQTPLEPALSKNTQTSGTRAKQPSNPDSGILMTDAEIAGKKLAGEKKDSFRADKLASAVAPALDSPAPRSMSETVEVSGAAIAPEPEPYAANLMARNEALKIEKAKPAPPETGAQPVALQAPGANKQLGGSAARTSLSTQSATLNRAYSIQRDKFSKQALTGTAIWTINDGVLRRSTDGGVSWQNVVSADHPLLCYAPRDQEVWTGGQAGALFHSSNGGITWVQVQPSINGKSLSADITHIALNGPLEVVVSTSNNETWSTTDGGQTWEKK